MKTAANIHAEHVTNKRQFNWYNVLMVIVMSFGALAYGYSTAIIGPTLGKFSWQDSRLSLILPSSTIFH